MNMGSQAMFSFEKGDRIAQINIGQEDDETQIVVVVGKNQWNGKHCSDRFLAASGDSRS